MGTTVHTFNKGIQSDIDSLYLSGETYDLLENGKLELSGDGVLLVKSIDGTQQRIELQKDNQALVPLATAIVDKYVIVLSQRGENSYLGYIDLSSSNPVYSIFQNKKDSNGNMVGFEFNLGYTEDSRVNMLIKKVYDGSVNIYLNDGINKSYAINSRTCFNGTDNEYAYNQNSFSTGKGTHIMGTHLPKTDNIQVTEGGQMKPGVYVFFIRYLDPHKNKTSFFYNIKPITIHPNREIQNERVSIPITEDDSYRTNKKVRLSLNGINTDYKYVEVSYVRKYNTKSSEQVQSKLIGKVFTISSTSITIDIDGSEPLTDITIEEVFKVQPLTSTWKSAIIKNNRMFFGGLGQYKYVSDEHGVNFFKRIVPKFFKDVPMNYSVYPINDVGYWPGQIYQFVGYFIYDDLTASRLFPLAGYYVDGTYNDTGFVKVPDYDEVNTGDDSTINVRFDVMQTIDGKTANEYFVNDIPIELRSRIVGINILRSERVPNLLYSGIVTPTTFRFHQNVPIDFAEAYYSPIEFREYVIGYNDAKVKYDGTAGTKDKYLAPITSQSYKTAYHYPFYKGIAPGYFVPNTFCLVNFKGYTDLDTGEKMRLAFYSPDIMLNRVGKISNGQTIYVEFKHQMGITKIDSGTTECNPPFHGAILDKTWLLQNRLWTKATAYLVPEKTTLGPGNFSSYIKDYFNVGKKSGELLTYVQLDIPARDEDRVAVLRSNNTSRYLGLELKDYTIQQFVNELQYWHDFMYVNIYSTPNDQTFYSSVANTIGVNRSYYIIDDPIGFDDLFFYPTNISNKRVYGGDCNNKWFQFLLNKSAEFGGNYVTGEPDEWFGDDGYGKPNSSGINNCYSKSRKSYHFGLLAAFKARSEVNPAARCTTDNSTYFEAENGNIPIDGNSLTYKNAVKTYVTSGSEKYYFESHEAYTSLGQPSLLYRVDNLGSDSNSPTKYLSNIMYSDTALLTEKSDSFRSIDFSKSVAFANSLGGIEALIELKDYIFVIHRQGVTLHTSEMQMQQVNENKTVSLGSGEVLPKVYQFIGEYGAQSFMSVVKGLNGIYGYDENKNVLWCLRFENTTQYDLVTSKLARKFIRNYISDYGELPLAISINSHRPYLFKDNYYNKIAISLKPDNSNGFTIYFDEGIDAFTNSITEPISYSFGFGNLCYISNKTNLQQKNKFYTMTANGTSEKLSIFGNDKTFRFTVRSNGGKEEGAMLSSKLFDSVLLSCNFIVFDRIRFDTDYMVGQYDTFFDLNRNDFWSNPAWKEHNWAIPILQKTDAKYGHAPIPVPTNQNYIFGIDTGTGIRGMWFGMTIEFDSQFKDEREISINEMMVNFKKSEL